MTNVAGLSFPFYFYLAKVQQVTGLCQYFYSLRSKETNHTFTIKLTLQRGLRVHLWNFIYKARKNMYVLKQLKIGKYLPVKLVCWAFFLTLLNPSSLSLWNLIMLPNIHFPQMVLVGGRFFVTRMLFFKTPKPKGRKMKHTDGETRARKCILLFLEWAVGGYLSVK